MDPLEMFGFRLDNKEELKIISVETESGSRELCDKIRLLFTSKCDYHGILVLHLIQRDLLSYQV